METYQIIAITFIALNTIITIFGFFMANMKIVLPLKAKVEILEKSEINLKGHNEKQDTKITNLQIDNSAMTTKIENLMTMVSEIHSVVLNRGK